MALTSRDIFRMSYRLSFVWLSTSLRVRPVTLLAYVVVRDSARKDR